MYSVSKTVATESGGSARSIRKGTTICSPKVAVAAGAKKRAASRLRCWRLGSTDCRLITLALLTDKETELQKRVATLIVSEQMTVTISNRGQIGP